MRHDAAPAFTCRVHHARRGRRGPPSFPTGRLLRERQALPQNHSCQHARQPPCRATTRARRQSVRAAYLRERPVLRPHRCRPLVPARLELRLHLTRPPYQLVRAPPCCRVRPGCLACPARQRDRACQRGRSVRSCHSRPQGPWVRAGPRAPCRQACPLDPAPLAGHSFPSARGRPRVPLALHSTCAHVGQRRQRPRRGTPCR